jgi:hypothetical protein
MYRYNVVRFVGESAGLWAIGMTFMFIGYEMFSKRSFTKVGINIENPKIINLIFQIAVLFGVLNVTGNMVNLGFLSGGIQKILSLFGEMSLLFFTRLWGIDDNKKYRNYGIVICALQIMFALFIGYLRIQLITPLIIFWGGYFIGKGNIRYIFSYRAFPPIAALVVFFSVFGNLGSYRSHFIDAFTGAQQEEESPGYTIEAVQNSDRGSALIRSSNIAPISNIYELVDRNGFYNGQASLPLAVAVIPRALWPEKPTIELGTWFALEIGAASISSVTGRANNSINMTIPGELYLDFGWIGVALGCMLCGALLACFWNSSQFTDSPYNIVGTMWGGYLLVICLLGLGADLQIFITFTSTYLAFLILKKTIGNYANTERRTPVAR